MITPLFEVKQTDEFVIVVIKAPYIKASAVEFYILEKTFKVYAKPYFLRLVFQQELVEDGREKAQYDIATSELTLFLPKLHAGEFFENLDMLTLLLGKKELQTTTKDAQSIDPARIQEVTPTQDAEGLDQAAARRVDDEHNEGREDEDDEEEEMDWEFPQELPSSSSNASDELLKVSRYGFNRGIETKVFEKKIEEHGEIIEIPNPDSTPIADRRALRTSFESSKFDPEHYAADFMEDDEIKELIRFKADWEKSKQKELELEKEMEKKNKEKEANNTAEAPTEQQQPQKQEGEWPSDMTPAQLVEYLMQQATISTEATETSSNAATTTSTTTSTTTATDARKSKIEAKRALYPFTDDEKYILCNLPNKEYIIENEKEVMLGLLDILFAYSYNNRTTMGENTVESSWTIARLSPTLSWFDVHSTPKEVAIAFATRSLCYPLYRNWKLILKVIEDVAVILSLGKRYILKSLLSIRMLFEKGDFYYLLNRLYIDDYCVWIQSLSAKKLQSLYKEVKKLRLKKSDIPFNLEEIETLAQEEAMEGDDEEE